MSFPFKDLDGCRGRKSVYSVKGRVAASCVQLF